MIYAELNAEWSTKFVLKIQSVLKIQKKNAAGQTTGDNFRIFDLKKGTVGKNFLPTVFTWSVYSKLE